MKEHWISGVRGYKWAICLFLLSALAFAGLSYRIWHDRNYGFSMEVGAAPDQKVNVWMHRFSKNFQ